MTSSLSFSKSDDKKITLHSRFMWGILDLHLTQTFLGMLERDSREEKLKDLKKNHPKEYEAYLKARPVPVVISPKGILYMTDRHHLVSALNEMGVKEVLVEVEGIFSPQTPDDEFQEEMKKRGWVCLFDENGKTITMDDLPQDITGARNSFHRSLAWLVKDKLPEAAPRKTFFENRRARFLMRHLGIELKNNANVKAAVPRATRLLKTSFPSEGVVACNPLLHALSQRPAISN